MSGIWENYLLLRIANSLFIILGVVLFLTILVKLFKNAFINHCSSESVWKNVALYLSGIFIVFFSGTALIGAVVNGYAIAELESIGETLVNGTPYKEVLLMQMQNSFRYIIRSLIVSGISYLIYIKVVAAIKVEIEELRKKVVHRRL
jgi:hypothetical protein